MMLTPHLKGGYAPQSRFHQEPARVGTTLRTTGPKQAGCAPGRLDSDARNVTLMAGRYVVYLFNAQAQTSCVQWWRTMRRPHDCVEPGCSDLLQPEAC